MFQLFYKYLILNKEVPITGLGVFYIERKPAILDFANKVFVTPDLHINFKEQLLADDKSFYSFISKEKKIDVTEAAMLYNDFANSLKKDLNQQKTVTLPELGALTQNEDGKVFFKSAVQLTDYFPSVNAERLLRENTEHHVLVGDNSRTNTEMKEMLVEEVKDLSPAKDNWWIFAIGLGIIGIATIVYYYLHHGSLH